MKNKIFILITVISVLFFSFKAANSLMTERSKQQIVLHSGNSDMIVKEIQDMYKEGYRVTSIVSQPISTVMVGDTYQDRTGERHTDYGDIIVIMEK